jgi:TolB-like protein/Tfp pilus assembly protein PilF
MTLATGTRLGPYEIVSPLGAGGMGEVYRARDARLNREVAIKVLPAAFSADADRLRRFEQEARSASALNHPNILTIHDLGSHDGSPYVVFELLEGETLRERMAEGSLSQRRALDSAIEIARGLAAAHERGIVHRDLKPENVFLTKDGSVKILDFGLAKLTHPEAASGEGSKAPTQTVPTEPGVVMGTVGYMSPEQVRGQAADHRSDIFSFGAMLHEALSGQRAFRGATSADTMSAILKEEPPELTSVRPDLPPALAHIVRRCLEKSPAERFQSARDLGFALTETGGVSAPAPVRLPGRRPILLPALGAVVLAFLAVLFLADVGGLRSRFRPGAAGSTIQSLAVLPLENLSHDREQEYFSDGMTEELIADLGKIRALRVISRTSAMRYKGAAKSVPEIARELKVDAVVEGSVLRSGDRVRITAQLIRASTDEHLWSESYERDGKDVLALQSEVARAIAREIQVAVSAREIAQLASSRVVDPEAHRLYLLGRHYESQRSAEGLQKALDSYEQSIAKDPSYAAAYSGLADTYTLLGFYVVPAREAMPRAKAAALKALALDDSLAEAHQSVGDVAETYDWDWSTAEKEFRRSIELNPSYAMAHHHYSLHLDAFGRLEEALAEAKRALECDPLSPIVNNLLALQYYLLRRYDEAIAQYRRTLEIDPNLGASNIELGFSYAAKGMLREAIAVGEKHSATATALRARGALGYFLALSGDREGALRQLEGLRALSQLQYVAPHHFYLIYLGLGEKDQAFAWLEKAHQDRSGIFFQLKADPVNDPLRSDPRFADLLRRVGLSP